MKTLITAAALCLAFSGDLNKLLVRSEKARVYLAIIPKLLSGHIGRLRRKDDGRGRRFGRRGNRSRCCRLCLRGDGE